MSVTTAPGQIGKQTESIAAVSALLYDHIGACLTKSLVLEAQLPRYIVESQVGGIAAPIVIEPAADERTMNFGAGPLPRSSGYAAWKSTTVPTVLTCKGPCERCLRAPHLSTMPALTSKRSRICCGGVSSAESPN